MALSPVASSLIASLPTVAEVAAAAEKEMSLPMDAEAVGSSGSSDASDDRAKEALDFYSSPEPVAPVLGDGFYKEESSLVRTHTFPTIALSLPKTLDVPSHRPESLQADLLPLKEGVPLQEAQAQEIIVSASLTSDVLAESALPKAEASQPTEPQDSLSLDISALIEELRASTIRAEAPQATIFEDEYIAEKQTGKQAVVEFWPKERKNLLNLSRDLLVLIGKFLISAPYFGMNNRAFFRTCKQLKSLEGSILIGNNVAVNSILSYAGCCLSNIQNIDLQLSMRICARTITSLNLYLPQMNAQAVLDFVTDFPNLRALQVFKNKREEDLLSLGRLTQLQTLIFSHCESVDNLLEQFQNRTITDLRLERIPISSTTLSSIKKIGGIVKLHLVKCLNGDQVEGVQAFFSSLTSLTGLNLSKNQLTNETISGLSHLSSLRVLDLSHGNDTREEGAMWAADLNLTLLSQLKDLQEVNLCNTDSTRFAETLGALTQLKILDARYCNFSNRRISQLETLVNLEQLYLDGNDNITDRSFASFAKLTNLQVLSLDDCDKRMKYSGLMVHLPKMQSLRVLYLGGLPITDYAFSGFPKLQNLERLDLNGCWIDAKAFEYLVPLPAFSVLNLCNARFLGGNLSSLRKLTQLKTLSLADTDITDADLLSLSSLINLCLLDLRGCKKLTPQGITLLRKKLPYLCIRKE